MTSLPGTECGIGMELFDMCYRVRLDHSHFTVLLLSSLLGRLEESQHSNIQIGLGWSGVSLVDPTSRAEKTSIVCVFFLE